ncbi:MAG: PAS domain S-box protein [Desulfobacterales bacterium]|nr:PAS domain S-box protein [Desulfobacterales bacterium]
MPEKPTYAELEKRVAELEQSESANKQAQDYLELFKMTVASATDAIGISTPQGRHWYQNAAFDDLFGKIGDDPPVTLYCDENVGREVFETIMAGEEWSGEVQMRAKDGRILDILLRAYAFADESGRVLGLVGVHTDITAGKRMSELFKRVAQSTSNVFYEWDITTDSLHWFTDIAAELGYGPEEISPTIEGWINLIHPEDRRQLEGAVEEHRTSIRDINYYYRVKHKNGTWRHWHDHATPVLDNQNRPVRWVGGITDITKNKQAEAAVLSEKNFSETLISQLPGSFYMFAADGRMLRWNNNLEKVTGFTHAQVRQMNALDFFPENERDKVYQRIQDVFVNGISQVEANFLTRDGRKIPHVLTGARIDHDGATYLLGVGLDITDRIAAEVALKESEERFRQIAENIREVFWLFDWQQQRLLYVSPAYDHVWGRPRKNLYHSYDDWGDSIHPEDAPHAEETFNRIPETGGGELREYRIIRPDGSERWISDTGYAIKDGNGRIVRIAGIAEDITERKLTGEALSREKKRLAVTLRSIGDAVITTDRLEHVTLMNPIAESLTGWIEAEAIGKPLAEVFNIVNESDAQPCQNPVQQVLATGKTQSLKNHTLLISRDGNQYSIADSAAPIKTATAKIVGAVLVFRDITAAKRTEAELLKMEKLKSLGVLAGGIAHDFNNFLTGIIGNLSLAQMDSNPDSRIASRLHEMEKAALRAKDLTQQLLTFSKGGEPVKQASQIDTLVREAALFALRGSNVRCRCEFPDGPWTANVDAGQIGQVIHNLAINADQVMPEGGQVTITGNHFEVEPGNTRELPPGTYIQISIQDQGTGIKEEHIDKIFDPYFTTKQKGSGLGLAVVYSIIVKHDGQITVESELGSGTTFNIYLPADTGKEVKTATRKEPLSLGRGRILVMDDEDFIRTLVLEMLKRMGYEVALAKDGAETIKKYSQALESEQPFDAVILDLTIPGGMGGQATLARLSEIDKDVKAIVSSGYSNDPVMSNYSKYGFIASVRKPFVITELNNALQKLNRP